MPIATEKHEDQLWEAVLQQFTHMYGNRFDGDIGSYIEVLHSKKLKFNRSKPLDIEVRTLLIKLHKFI